MAVTGLSTMREELQSNSVDAIFTRGDAERLLERPKAQEELEKIVKSERGDHRLRAMAHELLLMLGKDPDQKMARIYSEGLNGAFMHNWWGLPGHAVNRFGETLIRFGESALPYLVKEMDDPTLMTYLGQEAPINRERRYSVGDLATWFVCRILDREYPDAPTPEERAPAREALQKEINERLAQDKRK